MKKTILFVIFFANLAILHAQWSLTGNAGTTPPTNFLGTTDANNLIFKVNNVQAGLLDYNISLGNAGFGYNTLTSNTGTYNTATGYAALSSNTSGIYNTANGFVAMGLSTTGSYNSAIGAEAMSVSNGSYNTAIGYGTLSYNSSGSYNTASGDFASNRNTTGSNNVSMGYQALYSNQTSGSLTAAGYQALFSNTSGTVTTAFGYQALYFNTSGSSNAADGYQALYGNSTGIGNTGLGYQALYPNSTGSYNTAVGFGALGLQGNGSENTAVGSQALMNTTGDDNTAIGDFTLYTNTTGNENIALGYDADVNASGYFNSIVIGEGATGTGSNHAVIGNPDMTSIGGYVAWSNLSDGRFKKNVKENVPGLEFIKQLQPITYTLDVTGLNKFIRPTPSKDKNGKTITPSANETAAIQEKEKIVYTGFIAQDVEAVAKKMNYAFSGIDAAQSDKDLYKLRYSDFVVPLVKALQELSNTNDSLKSLVDTLQSQITSIQQQLNSLQKGSTSVVSLGESPMLNQSFPNPFSNNTVISYYIPASTGNAQIIIMDMSGKSLKNIVLGSKGPGQVIIAAGTLASGTYTYSLVVDGIKIDTKQMILIK